LVVGIVGDVVVVVFDVFEEGWVVLRHLLGQDFIRTEEVQAVVGVLLLGMSRKFVGLYEARGRISVEVAGAIDQGVVLKGTTQRIFIFV